MRCCHHQVLLKSFWKLVSRCSVLILALGILQIFVNYRRIATRLSAAGIGRRATFLLGGTEFFDNHTQQQENSEVVVPVSTHTNFKVETELGKDGELKWRQGNSWIQFIDLTNLTDLDGYQLEQAKCPANETEIVFIVMSWPNQTYDRNLARNVSLKNSYLRAHNICAIMMLGYDTRTWSNDSMVARTPKGMLVSRELYKEGLKHGDVVMVDIPDEAGEFQTTKVLSGFAWVRKFVPNAQIIGRIDVRTFVNLERLLEHLKPLKTTVTFSRFSFTSLLSTHADQPKIFGTPALARDIVDAKNYSFRIGRLSQGVTKMEPPFAMGFAYFVTADYADAVLAYSDVTDMADDVDAQRWDDVYVTGRVAAKLGVAHEWIPYDYSGNYSFEIGCEGTRDWITNPHEMSTRAGPVAVFCMDEFLVKFVLTKLTWIKITEELRAKGYESCFFAFDPSNRVDQPLSLGTSWMF